MNDYFSLYDLPRTFSPDREKVKKSYLRLSRHYHPDRYATATPAEASEALKQSARNNEAYATLSDPDKTMAYLLRLHGMLEDEEKYTLPPSFLMEMMELNEVVDNFREGMGDEMQVAAAIADYEAALTAGVRPLLDSYESGDVSEDMLASIKDYYFRKKYLERIKSRL